MLTDLEKLRSEILVADLGLEEPDPLKAIGCIFVFMCLGIFKILILIRVKNFKSNQNVKKKFKIKVKLTPTGVDV